MFTDGKMPLSWLRWTWRSLRYREIWKYWHTF